MFSDEDINYLSELSEKDGFGSLLLKRAETLGGNARCVAFEAFGRIWEAPRLDLVGREQLEYLRDLTLDAEDRLISIDDYEEELLVEMLESGAEEFLDLVDDGDYSLRYYLDLIFDVVSDDIRTIPLPPQLADHPDLLEASLSAVYGGDPLGDYLRGEITSRRISVLIAGLPRESAWRTKLSELDGKPSMTFEQSVLWEILGAMHHHLYFYRSELRIKKGQDKFEWPKTPWEDLSGKESTKLGHVKEDDREAASLYMLDFFGEDAVVEHLREQ